MRLLLIIIMYVYAIGAKAQEQVRHIKPEAIHQMPKISLEEYEKSVEELENAEDVSAEEQERTGDLTVFTDLYSGFCSWYCGGEIL